MDFSFFSADDPALIYVATHVFFPVEVPKESDHTVQHDLSLARAVCAAVHAYTVHICDSLRPQWLPIIKMLDNLQASIRSGHLGKDVVVSQLGSMQSGDILAFLIWAQRAAVIFRKQEDCTQYEWFEASANRDAVLNTGGRLICSYAGTAIGVPNKVFDDVHFRAELANFLSPQGRDDTDPLNVPAAHPEYITALLTGILRSVGHVVEGPCILKHVRDEVGESKKMEDEWRRSSLWLLIRVAIQTSLDRTPLGRASYKEFVLFFICNLAKDANIAGLSSNLLHLMSAKILRRLSKLGASAPGWLSDMALETCTCLQDTLEARVTESRAAKSPSPYWNPSELDLAKDIRLSLPHIAEYIRSTLANLGHRPLVIPFHPKDYYRGTLDDFLSSDTSFFDKAYDADPYVTLYDVEQSVEQGIDHWLAHVENVEEACTRLGSLMDAYLSTASVSYTDNPEYRSIMTLTAIELWVALDKLVVEEIPMLAEYSPEIPIRLLESLFLRETTSLQRLSCIYHYLSTRHTGSRAGLSVFSDKFTEDSFPVRYYDSSTDLQNLMGCTEAGGIWRVAEDDKLPELKPTDLALALHNGGYLHEDQYGMGQQFKLDDGAVAAKSLPPSQLLHSKVVVFELQCPLPFRVWRSAIAHILYRFDKARIKPFDIDPKTKPHDLLSDIPALQPYLVGNSYQASPAYSQFRLACFHPDSLVSRDGSKFGYAFKRVLTRSEFSTWWGIGDGPISQHFTYRHLYYFYFYSYHYSCLGVEFESENLMEGGFSRYIGSTVHTSNDVLSSQADCPPYSALDGFIAFGHLRSGDSLQWVNILRELRGRTLNLSSHEVHFLLAQMTSQVGSLDSHTGVWVWHQEVQSTSFCCGLLDELQSLFLDVSAGSLDDVSMHTISMLLTRVLASSPCEGVSDRVLQLLRDVRWKTLEWVQELAYNLMQAPMNEERRRRLYNMAATCRSTFDVTGTSTLRKVLHSAQDVEAVLSCAFFQQATNQVPNPEKCDESPNCHPGHVIFSDIGDYSGLLHQQDRRLSVAVEGVLRDVIQADVSDRGIDLAVRDIWPGYRPGPRRWEPEQHPNSHWLVCTTAANTGRSQIVHINLLDGSLLVDGRPLAGLPREIRGHPLYKQVFCGRALLVIPSDLPGMDFATLSMVFDHSVHFSLRGDDLVIRAQRKETKDIMEIVPPDNLKEDFPMFLIEKHVHWLNLSTSVIEIRPLENMWIQSPNNWQIASSHGKYHVYKDREFLVDMQSPTWAMVSGLLECLDPPENLVVTTLAIDSSQKPSRLSVTLPRHGLSFFVNRDRDLESDDFKEMVYDENQGIETLFGLVNRLVLRKKGQPGEGPVPRRVLVPLHPSRAPYILGQVPYHVYNVDTELGGLTGHSSLESKQILAYLHHCTSVDWKPDPLTGKTGAQEALSILGSAGCQSLLKFHHGLGFYPDPERTSPWYPQNASLLNENRSPRLIRGSGRAEHLFPQNISPATFPRDCDDTRHVSSLQDLELEDTAYTVASVVYHWPINALTTSTISNWAEMWDDAMSGTTTHPPSPYDGTLWNPRLPRILLVKVHNVLQGCNDNAGQQFGLLFLLPTLAYCSSHPQTAFLSMLLALAKKGTSGSYGDYKLLDGYLPTEKVLRYHIDVSCSSHWPSNWNFIAAAQAVECLLKAWPSENAPTIQLDSDMWDMASLTSSLQELFSSCYQNLKLKEDLTRALLEPRPAPNSFVIPGPHLQYMFTQLRISQTASGQTPSVSCHRKSILPSVPSPTSSLRPTIECSLWQVTLAQLFSDRRAPVLPDLTKLPPYNFDGERCSSPNTPQFNQLLSSLPMNECDPPFQEQYIAHLHASARHVREEYQLNFETRKSYHIEELKKHFAQCKSKYMDALRMLRKSLDPTADSLHQALARSGQWPLITVDSLLKCLASTSQIKLSESWQKCLVSFALLLLELQRSRRLLRFASEGLEEEFTKELENEGCDGWNAEQYPDWLLVQLQGDFLIRGRQADIAMEMISPQSGENTVMQVNMGEGKSSVIIPITAATLANGHQLVRVIVPKALTVQMFYLLVDRLGGLANRPIYHLPVSRSDYYPKEEIESLYRKMSLCVEERGILLVQPEHVLSLKLTSLERQLPECKLAAQSLSKVQKSSLEYDVTALSLKFLKESYLANVFRGLCESLNYSATVQGADNTCNGGASDLLDLQKWLHSRVRDILDESDEILHARHQLIYTIGHQQHMEGYPDRWTVIQQILKLVKRHASSLSQDLPDSVEYGSRRPGSFPYFRILPTSDAGRRLILLLVGDVMAGCLPNFPFRLINKTQRDAIRSFIYSENVRPERTKDVEEYVKRSQQSNLWTGLLLLRGLFASNILLFALTERRWRVDYGLDLDHRVDYGLDFDHHIRLAVPYRAKDVPAPGTQFGHPDITILLTCLSYYYTGLSEEQLRIAFQTLLNQDDPTAEYALWVKDCGSSLPSSLRILREFNLKSSEQWDEYLYPSFAYNQAAIDFYLSRIVFPREAKEYPWKLAASSWDLAEKRESPITGFSGTSDGQYLLPISITQRELDHQQGADARVLAYLLQRENDCYMLTARENGQPAKTLELLRLVVAQQPEIRVLLDVGAQILDVSNHDLAREWLNLTSAAGAIYFDEKDNLMALTRYGATQPLMTSSLAQQLDRCVIYLDDAHTRGTDLKFPVGFRAAVTLGPRVTKDRLVQGCMRMRKLGHDHSVMFFAPLEVDQGIRSVTHKKDRNIRVTSADVLKWAIHETLTDISQRAPYWAQQGMSHKTRSDAWTRFCNNEATPEQLADAWLQPEVKSLAALYAPSEDQTASGSVSSELEKDIGRHCEDLGVAKPSIHTAQLDEQLERQVNREIEREREVELPPRAEPAIHSLHPDVVAFVKTGTIRASNAFRPVFTSLEKSSAATRHAHVWSPFILATADFCETIKHVPTHGRVDQYLRPVQWVLSGKKNNDRVLVVVSPFEVDRLMPDIRVSKHVHLHVYTPRTSERMKPADDLMLYSIPPVPDNWEPPLDLIDQLNIFAGQVYLRDWDAYLRVCRFLGIQKKAKEDKIGRTNRYNLFSLGSRKELEDGYSDSLLPSVMMLLAIRRRGLPFADTHMGKILQGRSLTEKDFECPAHWGRSSGDLATRDGRT